ncbi:trans-aconitate 2-methyltransferase [Streptomyces sp. NBC_00091]|uniref:class I SAM-dependent methyltransferase n=1 Tax=Streptomyces sp. NBC_00091 TaxID=2975648 RepID=UPI00225C0B71|nr:class I SAM-dependent methyltransferase [Streptomyces sp. NBC_00091]MCX5377294.1 class I SAM-dependent methyltransferase [Streptomyces sp. NBC_00091]
MARYLFDSADVHAGGRFTALESCYDPFSRRQLELTGLARGWRCLEIGGGSASVGDWLGECVGPQGEVTVTELEPRWAASPQRPAHVRLLRHDIVRDPLPGKDYDLIHARLVLLHLPQRIEVLKRLVAALRPGGWLVLEEFDCGWTPVLAAPDEASASLFDRVHSALMGLLEKAGADPLWGRRVLGAMAAAGLQQLAATTYAQAWPGGSAGIALHHHNTDQVADRLATSGVSTGDLEEFQTLLKRPDFVVNSYPLISARGRRTYENDKEVPR